MKINHPRNETPCGKREGRRFSNHKGEIVVFCGRKVFLRYFITLRMFILLTLENSPSVKKKSFVVNSFGHGSHHEIRGNLYSLYL